MNKFFCAWEKVTDARTMCWLIFMIVAKAPVWVIILYTVGILCSLICELIVSDNEIVKQ
jgi:hypothetical protein